MIKTDNAYERVIKVPETITKYLAQSTPFHKIYIPPKVKTIDINGSTSKKDFSFVFILVVERIAPTMKKIRAIDRTCP